MKSLRKSMKLKPICGYFVPHNAATAEPGMRQDLVRILNRIITHPDYPTMHLNKVATKELIWNASAIIHELRRRGV